MSYGPRLRHGGYAGGKEQPLHYIWRSMMARCYRKTDKSYRYYGARGIRVCVRWHEYQNFAKDMGERPSPDHSLERVDVNDDYYPDNCCWATRSEQQKNKTSTKLYVHEGRAQTLVEWARELGISKELAHWRINTWGTFEKGKKWQLLPRTA